MSRAKKIIPLILMATSFALLACIAMIWINSRKAEEPSQKLIGESVTTYMHPGSTTNTETGRVPNTEVRHPLPRERHDEQPVKPRANAQDISQKIGVGQEPAGEMRPDNARTNKTRDERSADENQLGRKSSIAVAVRVDQSLTNKIPEVFIHELLESVLSDHFTVSARSQLRKIADESEFTRDDLEKDITHGRNMASKLQTDFLCIAEILPEGKEIAVHLRINNLNSMTIVRSRTGRTGKPNDVALIIEEMINDIR